MDGGLFLGGLAIVSGVAGYVFSRPTPPHQACINACEKAYPPYEADARAMYVQCVQQCTGKSKRHQQLYMDRNGNVSPLRPADS